MPNTISLQILVSLPSKNNDCKCGEWFFIKVDGTIDEFEQSKAKQDNFIYSNVDNS